MRYLLIALFFITSCSGDTSSPPLATLSIQVPEDQAIIGSTRVEVRGSATGVASVEVNGDVVDVVGGEWSTVLNASDGPLDIEVVAGALEESRSVTVDATAPLLVLESPERGFYQDLSEGDSILVKGRVEDATTGIESVFLGGQSIVLGTDGSFETEVLLREGLNDISISAVDGAGNESTALRGGIAGSFATPTETVGRAFRVFVQREALNTLETVIEETVTPELVTSFVTANFMNENVAIDTITFDPIDLEVNTSTGALSVTLNVANVAVAGSFTISDDVYPTTIEVVQMGVTLPLSVSATDDGGLSLSFGTAVLNLEDEDLRFNIAGLTQDDANFLRNVMRQVVEYAFANFLSDQVFDQLFDPNVLIRRIEVFDRVITFELKFETVQVFGDGILVELSVTMPDEEFEEVRDVPGALNRIPGNPNGPVSENDLLFTTTHQALDRIFHGVWRSGLLHQTFDQERFAGFELPIELTVAELGLVLGSGVTQLAPAGTPLALRLRPLLPPVVDLTQDSRISLALSETMVDLVLQPSGGEEIVVASIAAFLELDVLLELDGVEVLVGFETNVRADLDSEAVDFDDRAIEGLLTDILTLVPEVLAQSLRLRGEADVEWVILNNPGIELHGDGAYVTLSTAMTPNPDGFTLDL